MIDPQTPIDPATLDHAALLARFHRVEPIISVIAAAEMLGMTTNALYGRIYRGAIDIQIVMRTEVSGIRHSDLLAYIEQQRVSLDTARSALLARDAA